jgi:UDP:flavonoid glycosyltransferase YjiC (YdhE family)
MWTSMRALLWCSCFWAVFVPMLAESSQNSTVKYNITFFSLPFSHYVPMIPVAMELASRGHTVSFLCANRLWDKIGPRLIPHGIKWVPISDATADDKEEVFELVTALPYSVLSVLAQPMMSLKIYSGSIPTYQDALKYYRNSPHKSPNVFVMEPFAGTLYDLPYALNVPYVTISSFAPGDVWLPPNMVPASSIPSMTLLPPGGERTWAEAALAYAIRCAHNTLAGAVALALNAERLAHGLPLLSWPFAHLWRAPFVVGNVPATHDAIPLPTTVSWAGSLEAPDGASIAAAAAAATASTIAWLDAQLAAGRPVVYISMGSEAALRPAQIAALAEGVLGEPGWAVLWSLRHGAEHIPSALRPRDVGGGGGGAARVEAFVPQPAVLGHAAVRCFLSHAGMNSLNEALSRGIPLVLLPLFADQPLNAAILARLGAAAVVRKDALSPAAARAAVARVLADPGFAAAARRLRAAHATAPGTPHACDIVEAAASSTAAGAAPPAPWEGGGPLAVGLDLLLLHAAFLLLLLAACRRCGRRRPVPAGSADAGPAARKSKAA